jgi:hypothetical protein
MCIIPCEEAISGFCHLLRFKTIFWLYLSFNLCMWAWVFISIRSRVSSSWFIVYFEQSNYDVLIMFGTLWPQVFAEVIRGWRCIFQVENDCSPVDVENFIIFPRHQPPSTEILQSQSLNSWNLVRCQVMIPGSSWTWKDP